MRKRYVEAWADLGAALGMATILVVIALVLLGYLTAAG
jgi:hypothetical protein